MTGKITMTQNATTRDVGIIGTYNYKKAAAIWCMGSSYQIASDGTGLGSLYGAAYVYQSQAGQSVMAGGHQFVWAQNGSANVALGTNVWTSGSFIKNGGTSSQFLKADGSVDSNAYITGITKSMVTTALGYTPPTSDTDTKNTAGSSNHTGQTMYIIGALSQASNAITYSNSGCYIGSDGLLYSGTYKVLYNSTDFNVTDGQVGIGTASPAYKFDVVGNAQFGANSVTKTRIGSANISMVANNGTSYNIMAVSQDSSNHQNCSFGYGLRTLSGSSTYVHGNTVRISTNGSERVTVTTGGNVGIGITNPGYKLQVNGTCGGTSWTNTSDMRQKNRIKDESIELWQVANAPIFKFTWKDNTIDTLTHIGTSAQYWQTIVPEVVTTDGNGYLGLQYDVVALLAAITTAKKVQDHETRIQALERENAYLKNELKRLTE